jgi:hypothetical protein
MLQDAPVTSIHTIAVPCVTACLPARFARLQDPLLCSEDEVVRDLCDRHHPSLNWALQDAGTPWTAVS